TARRTGPAGRSGSVAGGPRQSRPHPFRAAGRGHRVLPRHRDDDGGTRWTVQTPKEDAGTDMTTTDDRSGQESGPIRRRRWTAWLLVPAIIGAVIGGALAARATPAYRS